MALGRSFAKSDGSNSLTVTLFLKSTESNLLPSLFKKERLSEDRPEQLALVHKKGEKLSKT